jgi:anti-sigma B factor antagonist
MMSTALRITETTTEHEPAAVLALAGELDLLSAPELYQRGARALENRSSLILDMSGVGFCDSSGFNALVRLRRRAEEAGGQLILAAPPHQVESLLALSGTQVLFPVHATLEEARAAHHGRSERTPRR